MALYGRHGEAPLPIVAAYSPAHCFDAAIEAARIALKYRTPVILLSDGYLANGSEPWRLPDVDDAARHLGAVRHRAEPRRRRRQRRVLAVPARSRDAGPPVGDPGHARARCTASAASRRRTAPATSTTRRRTTSRWSTCGPPRSPASPTTSRRVEVDGDVDAELLRARLGLAPGAPSTPRSQRAAPRGHEGGVGRTSSTSTRCPSNLGDIAAPLPEGARARDEPRPARAASCAAEYLVDAKSLTKVQGVPFTARELEAADRRRPLAR